MAWPPFVVPPQRGRRSERRVGRPAAAAANATVFDHLAHPPLPAGIDHQSHRIVRDLVDRRRAWVKLSGAYLNSSIGAPYPEATKIAQAFVKAAPERLVWGSDWPHPTAPSGTPNDAQLFDLLSEWAPDATARHRILVEN